MFIETGRERQRSPAEQHCRRRMGGGAGGPTQSATRRARRRQARAAWKNHDDGELSPQRGASGASGAKRNSTQQETARVS
jgi:hypothetical protein